MIEKEKEKEKVEDTVRVLRIIDYVGPRSLIEKQIKNSLHGERNGVNKSVTIRATTLGEFPEIMQKEKEDE